MDLLTLILFVAGLVILVVGAELLVRGASKLARAVGVSPLVVGLTIVAFGTSAPELAVSTGAALNGKADVALGNVVGSNIFNVLFILGLSAVIIPLAVHRQLVRIDVPVMILTAGALWLMAIDGRIDRTDGLVLIAAMVVYITASIIISRRDAAQRTDEPTAGPESVAEPAPRGGAAVALNLVFILVGLGLLILGAKWLVDGAVALATAMGVSELVVGLTVVAAGTSLPEVATSVMAALRGQRDIAVGNVVGSNILNILAILGIAAAIAPDGVAVARSALVLDIPFMVAVSVACLPVFFGGYRINRWEGLLFLAYYAAYTAYLILAAQEHQALSTYGTVLFIYVSPLVVVTLLVLAAQSAHKVRRAKQVSSGQPRDVG